MPSNKRYKRLDQGPEKSRGVSFHKIGHISYIHYSIMVRVDELFTSLCTLCFKSVQKQRSEK